MLPPCAHTPCPHISLDLNVNMNEKTWRASGTHCFQRLIQIMLWFRLIWFYFPVEEKRGTKWITQGEMTQEMRQWRVRAGDETDSGTEQSLKDEWKSACQRVIKVYVYRSSFLCLWRLFCPCGSASAWVTHREVGGSTTRLSPCQGRCSLHTFASRRRNDSLRCLFPGFPLNKYAYLVQNKRSYWNQCGLAYENYASSYTYSSNSAVVSQKTNISLYFLFSLLMYVCSHLLGSDGTISSNSCGLA